MRHFSFSLASSQTFFAGLKRTRRKFVTAVNVTKVCFDSEQLEGLSEVNSITLFRFLLSLSPLALESF